ncbi:MAG: crotonase/enoyl-CoA hydratase family protein [Oleiphilus sp.]|nr:MAG: crotonase/enoyl-CoA hydratase family protein [Oleiphilus sp.]
MTKDAMIDNRVKLEIRDEIAFVTLCRPEKLNALDMAMFDAIVKSAKRIRKDKSIRAVILSGEGKAFCSGLDVKSMFKNPVAALKLLIKPGTKISNLAQDVSLVWRELQIPVIAVTHGKCWGGGFQIALGADFRYSTESCTFSIMESRWGLIPDMAGSIALRELTSIDIAKELAMTAKVFDGNEAKSLGLVTHVCDDPMASALAFAEQLKQKSPDAIASTKLLFNKAWLSTVRQALHWETKLQRKLIGRFNQRTAIQRHQQQSAKDRQELTPFKQRS